jgi:hypothetical protein
MKTLNCLSFYDLWERKISLTGTGIGVEGEKVLNFEKLLLCKMKENWKISTQKTCKKTNLQDNFPAEVIRKPAHFCMMGKFWPKFLQTISNGW